MGSNLRWCAVNITQKSANRCVSAMCIEPTTILYFTHTHALAFRPCITRVCVNVFVYFLYSIWMGPLYCIAKASNVLHFNWFRQNAPTRCLSTQHNKMKRWQKKSHISSFHTSHCMRAHHIHTHKCWALHGAHTITLHIHIHELPLHINRVLF